MADEVEKKLLINLEKFNKYFKTDKKENFINYDINIFKDLRQLKEDGTIKSNYHQSITFSYLWLVSYLWKYAKYGNMEIRLNDIKWVLGLNPAEKKVNYIMKKDGLLDMIEWTETTRNFPIKTYIKGENGGIEIVQLSDLEKEIADAYLNNYNHKYTCKKPLLQYERINKEGLMYSRDDTLSISVFEFARIVLCKEMGVDAFMLYCFIKYKSKMACRNAIPIFQTEMENMLGFKKKYIRKMLHNLMLAQMIHIQKVTPESGRERNVYSIVRDDFW